MAAGDGKWPLNSVWLNASTDLLRPRINFGDLDTTEATVFTTWYLNAALFADPGSYNTSGFAATLVKDRPLFADAGAFNITGANAAFSYVRKLNPEPGTYNLTGFNATLVKYLPYPAPSDVRDGVIYGPGRIFTGTLVATSGETSVAIRSFTRKF